MVSYLPGPPALALAFTVRFLRSPSNRMRVKSSASRTSDAVLSPILKSLLTIPKGIPTAANITAPHRWFVGECLLALRAFRPPVTE
jgi:hypothetical protein